MRHLPKRINDHIYHAWLWSLAIFKLVQTLQILLPKYTWPYGKRFWTTFQCLFIQIPCDILAETWLKLLWFNWNFFPDMYLVYRADTMSSEKNAWRWYLYSRICQCLRRLRRNDLEVAEECVWVAVLSSGGRNLRIGNHCFDPNTTADT